MKGFRKLLLLAAMVMLGAFICVQGVSAEESLTGWQTIDGYTYYYKSDGTMKTGLLKYKNQYYYLRKKADSNGPKGSMVTGFYTIGDYKYYFSEGGVRQTGWQTINNSVYYFYTTDTVGAMATGRVQIGSYYYYFTSAGKMKTGWVTLDGAKHYFKKSGTVGAKKGSELTSWNTISGSVYYFKTTGSVGAMVTGRQKIGDYYYYFASTGKMKTGWVKVSGKKYYYKKSGTVGTTKGKGFTGWNKISGYYYYFTSKGVLKTSCWISSKYYVDENGRRLVSTVTPDGYLVNSKGVKVSLAKGWIELDGKYYYYKSGTKLTGWLKSGGNYYYLDSDGVRQTGWLTLKKKTFYLDSDGIRQTGWVLIDSKRYYFNSSGVLQKSTTVDGVKLDENGVATTARVLLVAGHGQGDVGANAKISGTTYYESTLARELATLVYKALVSSGKDISVTMYDQDYNLYTTMYNLTYYSKVTGPSVTWTDYDYVLEIHFNAGASDLSGNGSYTGTAMLVRTSKTDTTIDKAIAKNIKSLGFSYWAGGLVRRSDLLNMNLCEKAGVSYGLLETAFVDDKDDMTFYSKNKSKIASAVAKGILTGLGL
ncbi:MAG: N-acetylmuramoyl-L-alanine amidase [Lachnospiraceae bacterium]|nr:N-acetylmuramoyl-L-alanine amidase [Lachnospiraceae bacterium]